MHDDVHFKRIKMVLARTPEYPEGSIRHGYEFIAPLDREGHMSAKTWQENRTACIVHRFWGNEEPRRGLLVHRAGGIKGATWAFDYDISTRGDDETAHRFGEHPFVAGEYVSVRDEEDEMQTFKVVSVSPI